MGAHDVIFSTNNYATRKKWAKELFRGILPDVEFNSLIGTDSNSPIQIKTDLGKGEGDEITFTIRYPLSGEGEVGQETVEGNEEKMAFDNFKCTIEELNHAVDTGGKMDEQRVPWSLLSEGKMALQDWWAQRLTNYMFATLCGDSSYKMAGHTFAQACEEPDTYHMITPGDVTESSLAESDMMDLTFLDRMKQRAETMAIYGSPNEIGMNSGAYHKIRPLRIKGKNYYRVILHTYVYDRLRQNMNLGQLGDLKRLAGDYDISDIEFEYNGLLISKSDRIRTVYTNIYRNIIFGAQAAVFAWGGAGESKSTTMAFVPYEKDAKRFVMIRGGGIFGMKKVRFASVDSGVIVAPTYGKAL